MTDAEKAKKYDELRRDYEECLKDNRSLSISVMWLRFKNLEEETKDALEAMRRYTRDLGGRVQVLEDQVGKLGRRIEQAKGKFADLQIEVANLKDDHATETKGNP